MIFAPSCDALVMPSSSDTASGGSARRANDESSDEHVAGRAQLAVGVARFRVRWAAGSMRSLVGGVPKTRTR